MNERLRRIQDGGMGEWGNGVTCPPPPPQKKNIYINTIFFITFFINLKQHYQKLLILFAIAPQPAKKTVEKRKKKITKIVGEFPLVPLYPSRAPEVNGEPSTPSKLW